MISKLSENGTAGFVLSNGSMSSNTGGEGIIRQKLIENDLIDCMIALPAQLFYTTTIPVCLWFISKNKKEDKERGYCNREGQTLFIDAREMGTMVSNIHKELTTNDIAGIVQTYHAWRSEKKDGGYEDKAGYSKSAILKEIKANDYVLTPGRYVGLAEIEDDGIQFETKMSELSKTLYNQMEQTENLDKAIRQNLEELGYGE
jgi:type I restriction enzyme M protein